MDCPLPGDCPNFRVSENGTVPFDAPMPLQAPSRSFLGRKDAQSKPPEKDQPENRRVRIPGTSWEPGRIAKSNCKIENLVAARASCACVTAKMAVLRSTL